MKKSVLGKGLLWLVLILSIVLVGACGEAQPNIRELLTEDADKWALMSEQGTVEMIFGENGIIELVDDNGQTTGQATYEINERQTEIAFQFMQDTASIKSGTLKKLQLENDGRITGDYVEAGQESSVPIRLEKLGDQ